MSEYLSVCLSFSVYWRVYLFVSVSLPACLSIILPLSVCAFVSLCVFVICFCLCLPICPSDLSDCLPVHLSACLQLNAYVGNSHLLVVDLKLKLR